jgi:preprotein translocase subunit SecA
MMQKIDQDITLMLVRAQINQNVERKEVSKKKLTNESKDDQVKRQAKSTKVGRNDPCPCGSGKKYKQCCGK